MRTYTNKILNNDHSQFTTDALKELLCIHFNLDPNDNRITFEESRNRNYSSLDCSIDEEFTYDIRVWYDSHYITFGEYHLEMFEKYKDHKYIENKIIFPNTYSMLKNVEYFFNGNNTSGAFEKWLMNK